MAEQQVVDQRNLAAIQLYFVKGCQACHGLQAEGIEAKSGPQLAGLSEEYLSRQLTHFRERVRGGSFNDLYGRQMTQAANNLTDDNIAMLAELLSGVPPRFVPDRTLNGDVVRGGQLYVDLDCAQCHGEQGEGGTASRVAGQQDAYLALQLRNYQNGIRGSHSKDAQGQLMAVWSKLLQSGQDIVDISAYMSDLMQISYEPTKSDAEDKDSRDVVVEYYARIDGGDKDVIYDLLSSKVVFHFPGGQIVKGPNNYWAAVSQLGIYTPDFVHVLTDVRIDERDSTVVHVGKIEVQGTTAAGEEKSLSSENARYKVVGGKIVEAWVQ